MTTLPPRQNASRPFPSKKTSTKEHNTTTTSTLQFTSPRCQLDEYDDLFLPSEGALQQHGERWKHMSAQAGSHRQDETVLDLTNFANSSPHSLRVGVPPQLASRVEQLHLCLEDSSDNNNTNDNDDDASSGDESSRYSLPEWLDVVSSLFFQLQHLYTQKRQDQDDSTPSLQVKEDGNPKQQQQQQHDEEKARMRRLYILYRLPHLQSIDGKPVTMRERQLARPNSPNGYRVKRDEWIRTMSSSSSSTGHHDDDGDNADSTTALSDDDDNDDDCSSHDDSSLTHYHGDAVEVSLYGVVKRVCADPPQEEWSEPMLPKPFEAPPPAPPAPPAPTAAGPKTTVAKRIETSTNQDFMGKQATTANSSTTGNQGTSGRISERKKASSSCGHFGLAAAFADGNPCVSSSSRRGVPLQLLEEPHTVDYYPAATRNGGAITVRQERENDKGRRVLKQTNAIAKLPKRPAEHATNDGTLEEGIEVQRPMTPKRDTSSFGETDSKANNTLSASLSSPFPMQFRSKSFSGALPSRTTARNTTGGGAHSRKVSSPDLVPTVVSKRTIDAPPPSSDLTTPLPPPPLPTATAPLQHSRSLCRQQQQQAHSRASSDRPPPCPPGLTRRVAPLQTKTPSSRRSWRSKRSIRSTSIVDDEEEEEDDDEDALTDDEDVIEHD